MITVAGHFASQYDPKWPETMTIHGEPALPRPAEAIL